MEVETLLMLSNTKQKDFLSKLIPNIDKETILGITSPQLKEIAKETIDDYSFIDSLPHYYFEENQLHAFIITYTKDYELIIKRIYDFLPYVDNWATCDQINPTIYKKYQNDFYNHIMYWMKQEDTYTIRFGIRMLKKYYLDKEFNNIYLHMVNTIHHDDYYVKMMQAWYFSDAFIKQFDTTYDFFKYEKIETFVRNKSIQKALESRRISDKNKDLIRQLKD